MITLRVSVVQSVEQEAVMMITTVLVLLDQEVLHQAT